LREVFGTGIDDLVTDARAGKEAVVVDVGLGGPQAAFDDIAHELAEAGHRRDHTDRQF
jgi:hypothetical protein